MIKVVDIPIWIANGDPARAREPMTLGVPLPKGEFFDQDRFRLFSEQDQEVPLQTNILDKWSDGSIRWMLCDWQTVSQSSNRYTLRSGQAPREPLPKLIDGNATYLEAKIGHEEIRIRKAGDNTAWYCPEGIASWLIPQLVLAGKENICDIEIKNVVIENRGEIRGSFLISGDYRAGTNRCACWSVRVHVFAGLPIVRLHIVLHNPNAAEHPGGTWDLGNGGSIYVQNFTLQLPWRGENHFTGKISTEIGQDWITFEKNIKLIQESSGGNNWNSTNHISATRKIPLRFQGYELEHDQKKQSGLRATPCVFIKDHQEMIAASIPLFWQNFPKAIYANQDGITVQLFPESTLEPHEIQGGEQKTHVVWLAFREDGLSPHPLDWTRSAGVPFNEPTWVESTGAISYLTAQKNDPHSDYLDLVESAIKGDDTFFQKREVIDEYGWRHYGDIYGDHEAILHKEFGPCPRISHYNNQYDCIAGFAYQWLRSGKIEWFEQMRDQCYHVRDIDIYNTDQDKSAYNHGLFWHTYHYVDADTGTHRSYPKLGKVPPKNYPIPGGGPGNEHNYTQGLLLHYYLTGERQSREAVTALANWVIDMDDGRLTVFRFLTTRPTGLASASRTPDYHGPGRGSANSLSVLIDAHRLTGDPRYLNKAEELIARVIDLEEEIADIVGMFQDGKFYIDAENRWFYVMFIQSLGKYLDYKAERNQLDRMYAFARDALLRYARWMEQYEYPYLDKPEVLEYPTETWAAQDLRKCEVFQYASLHTTDIEEKRRFENKAEFFYQNSIATLKEMPTRTLCRPVVLLMSYGWSRSWFKRYPDSKRPLPDPRITSADYPQYKKFVPQKVVAIKRAKILAGISTILFLCFVIGAIILILKK